MKKEKICLIVGVLVLVAVGIWYLVWGSKDSSNKEVSDTVLNDLLKTLAIDEDNSKDMDLYHKVFDGEKSVEMAKLSEESQSLVIEVYASYNNMYEEVSGKDYSVCKDGAGYCGAVSASNLNTILSKYNFGRTATQIFDKELIYNNMYLFTTSGWADEYESIKHDISAEYDNDDIVVVDQVTLMSSDNGEEKQKISYRFKTKDNKNYYLDSIKLA